MLRKTARRTPAVLGLLLLAMALAALACGRGEDGTRAGDRRDASEANPRVTDSSASARLEAAAGAPIVLISIDTLRSDHLPAYGYAGVATPAIDRLRGDGVLFARAYSPVPLTTPAHTSMMTGLLPPNHGVRDNAGYRLADDGPTTLAAGLAALGYRTGAAISSYTLRAATGLDRGFETYDDRIESHGRLTLAQVQRAGHATLDTLLPWLRQVAAGPAPFFAFLHLYEPHTPHQPPPAFADYRDPYDGEIAAADAVVQRLLEALDALDLYARSTVILVSDHGEGLGDHGEAEHGILLYREALQVPLIIKLPNHQRAGATVATPVQIVDLMPTVLSLAGATTVPDGLDGRSLLPALTGEGEVPSRGLYAESFHPQLRYGWSGLTAWIEGRWHLIDGPDPELYDLEADPQERHNKLRDERRVYARMREALAAVVEAPEPPGVIDEETRRRLESLGYLGSSRSNSGPLPDPKSQLATLEPLRRGIEALAAGDHAHAIALLQQALALNDHFEAGWTYLGMALEESGRKQDAFDAYQRSFKLSSGSPEVVDALVRMSLALGRLDDLETFVPLAIENHPGDVDLHFLATRTLLLQRRFPEAQASARADLARAPERPDAHYQLGAAAMGLGQLATAERHLLDAIEAAGGAYPPALQDLAVLYLSQGRKDEARRLLERLITIQPQNPVAIEQLRRLEAGHGGSG